MIISLLTLLEQQVDSAFCLVFEFSIIVRTFVGKKKGDADH
jgi:hypothetical protein